MSDNNSPKVTEDDDQYLVDFGDFQVGIVKSTCHTEKQAIKLAKGHYQEWQDQQSNDSKEGETPNE